MTWLTGSVWGGAEMGLLDWPDTWLAIAGSCFFAILHVWPGGRKEGGARNEAGKARGGDLVFLGIECYYDPG